MNFSCKAYRGMVPRYLVASVRTTAFKMSLLLGWRVGAQKPCFSFSSQKMEASTASWVGCCEDPVWWVWHLCQRHSRCGLEWVQLSKGPSTDTGLPPRFCFSQVTSFVILKWFKIHRRAARVERELSQAYHADSQLVNISPHLLFYFLFLYVHMSHCYYYYF